MVDRLELKSLTELRALLEKAKELYEDDGNGASIVGKLGPEGLIFDKNKGKIEVTDKIRLLEMIGEIENEIRGEEYKEKLLNGEA